MKSIIYKIVLLGFLIFIALGFVLYFRYFGEVQFTRDFDQLPPPPSTIYKSDSDWLILFDGLSLEGWVPKIKGELLGKDSRQTFSVVDHKITVDYENYETWDSSFGHLFYEIPYGHYILQLEYRFFKDQLIYANDVNWAWRNSGVMIHSQAPTDIKLNQEFPVSLEVQLLGAKSDTHRPTGNLCTPGTHVTLGDKIVTKHCINSLSSSFSGDQWVRLELEVRGNKVIRHFINEVAVFQYSFPKLDMWSAESRRVSRSKNGSRDLNFGYIGLQSESHPVQFRKIRLLPLNELALAPKKIMEDIH